jgi:hypothetical protein
VEKQNSMNVALPPELEKRVEALIKESQASGEATEMTEHDWQEVERQGTALIRARKKA